MLARYVKPNRGAVYAALRNRRPLREGAGVNPRKFRKKFRN
jgi:hypothetical protein